MVYIKLILISIIIWYGLFGIVLSLTRFLLRYPFFKVNGSFVGIISWSFLIFLILFLDPLESYKAAFPANGLSIVFTFGPAIIAGFLIYVNDKVLNKGDK